MQSSAYRPLMIVHNLDAEMRRWELHGPNVPCAHNIPGGGSRHHLSAPFAGPAVELLLQSAAAGGLKGVPGYTLRSFTPTISGLSGLFLKGQEPKIAGWHPKEPWDSPNAKLACRCCRGQLPAVAGELGVWTCGQRPSYNWSRSQRRREAAAGPWAKLSGVQVARPRSRYLVTLRC
jgi:hypothetical protein